MTRTPEDEEDNEEDILAMHNLLEMTASITNSMASLHEKALDFQENKDDLDLHMSFKRKVKLDSSPYFEREMTKILDGQIHQKPVSCVSTISDDMQQIYVRDAELENDPHAYAPPSKKKMKKTLRKEKAR